MALPCPIPARGESGLLNTRKEEILSKTALMGRKF